ncbi:MAG: DUF3737 family protein [Muribaculaceae bacterium]|nr:DUF3737 family protein [Muribaculaceae bacterium]MDE6525967.1 DUF3737 family protein [Muribaculaceae bacterium]
MKKISNCEYGGERPLFGSSDLLLENVTIHAGESALKACRNIIARKVRFEGKYPFWHTDGFTVEDCVFTPGARAALWYSKNCRMSDSQVDAPKMFREMDGIEAERVRIPDAQETFWHCRNIRLRDVELANADYLFMHCENIDIRGYRHEGNYSFQYCRNVEIHNALINSKDAFWNTDNVTVYDSELNGEYLGWHSHGLRLVRCHISGTQPLCYTRGLILEDCTFAADCDLAFEDSDVHATVNSTITSVKNPRTGRISAKGYGEIIINDDILAPADCEIITFD